MQSKTKTITYERFHTMRPSALAKHPAVSLQKEDHGFPIYLVRQSDGVIVSAGCRWFTFEEAAKHWKKNARNTFRGENFCQCSACLPDYAEARARARARKMIVLVPKLERRAKRLGWT